MRETAFFILMLKLMPIVVRGLFCMLCRLILSGSSEEQTVRLYCAQTGRLVHLAEMYPGRKHGSLYVQSLR